VFARVEERIAKSSCGGGKGPNGVDNFRYLRIIPILMPETGDPDTNVYEHSRGGRPRRWLESTDFLHGAEGPAKCQLWDNVGGGRAMRHCADNKDLKKLGSPAEICAPVATAEERRVASGILWMGSNALYTRPQDEFIRREKAEELAGDSARRW